MNSALAVIFLGFVLTPLMLLGGLISISRRNIKRHQFCMLTGFGFLAVSLLFFWCVSYSYQPFYAGAFREAFRLLFWIQSGLGLASLALGSVTLWAVMENVWELHRRTGMFTFFSGVVTSIVTLVMICMIWLT